MLEEQAHSILSAYLSRIGSAVSKSFETYKNRYPHKSIHRRTTSANVICDEVWAEIVNTFADDVPQVRPIEQTYGLRLLGIQGPSGEIEILLWFKKLDSARRPSSFLTRAARKRLAGENLEMFEQATILIVGYRLTRDESKILGVSISPPSAGRPEWFIDLEISNESAVIKIRDHGETQAPNKRVVVRRISQSRLGEG